MGAGAVRVGSVLGDGAWDDGVAVADEVVAPVAV